ncbi:MAG: RNA methyltransferase [Solirubrobacteraceae bacterium]|jgi:TrmH family RNA methyltransferase
MTITSPANQHLKEIRKLSGASPRAESARFVAEGEDLVTTAEAVGWTPSFVVCAPGLAQGRTGWVEVEPTLLSKVSTLGSGARVIGVYPQHWGAIVGPLAVALWGVGDPGNVGTVIRAAHAFGAACVGIGPGSADPYGVRAVRASMGAIFEVPVARFERLDDLPADVIALAPGAHPPLRGPIRDGTLLVGAERDGLPADVLARATRVHAIPQAAGDSLNAAMAATVALYEATRMAAP